MNDANLTKTEDLICRYKCLGLQTKEIADQLHRSEGTLRVHFKHIHTKLHIHNEVELVVWYIENVLHVDVKRMVWIGIPNSVGGIRSESDCFQKAS
jgi:DNA-binding CsgD family transcriptional regulator